MRTGRFRPITWALTAFVRGWRAVISPWYGDVCKFYPTCSEYGLEALHHHGALKGSWLTVTRIARCHPWSLGGYDPVPGSPRALAQQAAAAEPDPSIDVPNTMTASSAAPRGDV